jgi:hypothetical protein
MAHQISIFDAILPVPKISLFKFKMFYLDATIINKTKAIR